MKGPSATNDQVELVVAGLVCPGYTRQMDVTLDPKGKRGIGVGTFQLQRQLYKRWHTLGEQLCCQHPREPCSMSNSWCPTRGALSLAVKGPSTSQLCCVDYGWLRGWLITFAQPIIESSLDYQRDVWRLRMVCQSTHKGD